MSIRKRGDGWQVRVAPFSDKTVPTRAIAERVERTLKERKALGDLYIEDPTTLGDELDLHMERKQLGGRRGKLRPRSIEFVAQNLRPWQPLRDVAIPNLRRAIVEDHVRARARVAPVAARNELAELKAALRDAQARGQRVDPSIFTLELGRTNPRLGRALTIDDLDAIEAHMPARVKRIVPFCGTTSLRFSVATHLDESMLNLPGAELEIPEWLNKSRRDLVVPLAKVEVQLLREQLLARTPGTTLVFPTMLGRVYSKSGFRNVFVKALLAAGFAHEEAKPDGTTRVVADARFHDLRHTATSLMCTAGMRPEHVAARRGDADGGELVLRRYRHLYPGEVAGAVAAIDALFAPREGPGVVAADA